MKDRENFLDAIGVAASDYSYAEGDANFECIVKVTCKNGWVEASLVSEEEGGKK